MRAPWALGKGILVFPFGKITHHSFVGLFEAHLEDADPFQGPKPSLHIPPCSLRQPLTFEHGGKRQERFTTCPLASSEFQDFNCPVSFPNLHFLSFFQLLLQGSDASPSLRWSNRVSRRTTPGPRGRRGEDAKLGSWKVMQHEGDMMTGILI